MKRTLWIFPLLLFLNLSALQAKEGLWLPNLLQQLNEEELKEMGMGIDAADIYSLQEASITDAIVHFGGGCTASIISDKGLLLTNHHCGYSYIQKHSSIDDDLLENGFWAEEHGEELKNPGLTASMVKEIRDVTEEMLEGVSDTMSANERDSFLNTKAEEIREDAAEAPLEARVRSFDQGNAFFLFVTKTYEDVRLVGAPPSSIGKFGGDADNWNWPRHTGDFSLFRIYAGPENEPAEPAEENAPYEPEKVLPISLGGASKGDLAMVMGFPGRTRQHIPSNHLRFLKERNEPARIRIREKGLNVIDQAMAKSDSLRIQYAGKQGNISNYYKKWKGEIEGLERIDAMAKKKAREAEYVRRAKEEGMDGAVEVLDSLKAAYAELEDPKMARDLFIEFMYYGPDMIRFVRGYKEWVDQYSSFEENGKLDSVQDAMEQQAENFFSGHSMKVDRKLFKAEVGVYKERTPERMLPDIFEEVRKEFDGDLQAYGDHLYDNSLLLDPERAEKAHQRFVEEGPQAIEEDPAYRFVNSLYQGYGLKVRTPYQLADQRTDSLMRHYIRATKELFPKERHWYDANGTLRLSYGYVEGSSPRDGMNYRYSTTLEGVVEKYDSSSRHFDAPEKLLELHAEKDYGPYGINGRMPLCFTASAHTSGGNSGSPVIDGNGHLIGLNFDRSWESVMSDLMYDPSRCRNIAVDVRYLLFVIDRFADAGHLVEEMDVRGVEEANYPSENVLRNWIEEEPENEEAWYQLGSKLKDREKEEALDAFSNAIAFDPEDARSYRARALLYMEMDEEEKACADLRVLRDLDRLMLPAEDRLPDCEKW